MNRTAFDDITLVSDAFRLRPLTEADIEPVYHACQDDEIIRWLPLPQPYTLDVATSLVRELAPAQQATGEHLLRVIEAEGQFCGLIDLKHTSWVGLVTEIGYWVAPWARGRGLAAAGSQLLADWALTDQGLERVVIRAATGNAASQRVAEKAGFVREGVARNAGYVHDGRVDLVVYSKIAADLAG